MIKINKPNPKLIKLIILWFRNDLRLHDNPLFTELFSLITNKSTQNIINENTKIIPFYGFDKRHFIKTSYNSIKTNTYRSKFLIESVENLRQNLSSVGLNLLVGYGEPEQIIANILSVYQLEENDNQGIVYLTKEVTSEEVKVEEKANNLIKKKGGKLNLITSTYTLYHLDDIPFKTNLSDLPESFTQYKNKIDASSINVRDMLKSINNIKEIFPISIVDEEEIEYKKLKNENCSFSYLPTVETLSSLSGNSNLFISSTNNPSGYIEFKGGETNGIKRLYKWMFTDDHLKEYFDIRNGMLGEGYSTKISPWLSLGCISPRFIYYEVCKYEDVRKIKTKQTYWLIFELLFRDYFRLVCSKYKSSVFKIGGCLNIYWQWNQNQEFITKWKLGQTGFPLVDANMRELLHTGFMSNRGRQNVASFLIHDLNVDWRIGADHFESFLIDHDVCINYGNWNLAAGLLGGRINRFNISKQSRDYDCNGKYIKYWLPELKNIPIKFLFEPWTMPIEEQKIYNMIIGENYPSPCIKTNSAYENIPTKKYNKFIDYEPKNLPKGYTRNFNNFKK